MNEPRCEREVWYEAMGLPPRNCLRDDRMLCSVCVDVALMTADKHEKRERFRRHRKKAKP